MTQGSLDHLESDLETAVERWLEKGLPRPDVLVVAGSGLSVDLGSPLEGAPSHWRDILPFPITGIDGHALEVDLLRPREDRVVLYSRGRLHAYQGYTSAQIVFPIRFAARLGTKVVIMTNAAGGLRPDQRAGTLMLIRDHLNLTGMNPLWGPLLAGWGPQFPDMSHAYDPELRALVRRVADLQGLDLDEGVYAGVAGPSYETPAEVRMLGLLGGDAVGMSTVQEVIAAHHMGLRCAAISLISNPGAGLSDERLEHSDVLSKGAEARQLLAHLLEGVLVHDDLL